MLNNFKYVKVDVVIKSKKPHEFIGSMIRGALGYSLKKVTCINPSYICEECFAASNCLYYDFFEKQNSYHKYRLDFSLDSKLFEFSLYLFNDSKDKLPYILSALHKLFSETGLGRERAKPKEYYFYVNGKTVFDGKQFYIPTNYVKSLHVDSYCSNIKLQLQSPLRIKKDNKFLRDKDFDLIYILNSIYQRYLQLTNQERAKLPFKPNYEIDFINIYYKQLTRYSGRQKTKLSMDGLMGEAMIKNIDKQSYELLKLGEIIGAGKQTVMGLGKIEIKDLNE